MTKSPKNNPRKDFVWNAVGLTLNACNSLFFLIVVRFINGLDIAGIFTYAFALCIFLYTFVAYYNRSFQVSDTNNKYSFNSYLTCRVATSVVGLVAILAFALINGFGDFQIGVILLLAGFQIIQAISDCFYGALQKKHRLYQTGISLSLKAVLGLAVFAVVDMLTKDLALAILALILVNVFFFCIYDLRNYRRLYTGKVRLDFTQLRPLLRACLPIVIFSALGIYLSNCQKYILPYFEPDDIQAIFGILIMPATFIALVGSYLINPFINSFALQHEKHDYLRFTTATQKILLAIAGLGAATLVLCYFLGIPVLELIFQLDLSAYWGALQMIILASIFYAATLIISSLLTILRENRAQTYIYAFTAVATTVLSILMIQQFGIFGAVSAFFASGVILVALYVVLLQITLHRLKRRRRA